MTALRWAAPGAAAFSLAMPAAAQRGGALISAQPVAQAPAGTQAWRIRYWTTDDRHRPLAATGMVVAPRGTASSSRKVLAWAHGTSGVATRCAPSLMDEFWTHAPELGAVTRGYVVAAPDYPGLGAAGVHPYLVGPPTARSVLDAVRAARQIPGAGAGKRFAVWGESQGAHGALWVGQMARSYAPDLDLVGVAAAAPPTDLVENLRQGSDPSVRAMLTAFTAYSWSGYYHAPLSSLGNRTTQNIIRRLAENNCTTGARPKLGAIIGVSVLRRNLRNVDLGQMKPWSGYARSNSVDASAIRVPMLIAQNPRDVIVAPAVTRQFARHACRIGKRVRWIDITGKGHQTSATDTVDATLQWIDARFAGAPPPSDCGHI
jgi:acetyl esterase/lipase